MPRVFAARQDDTVRTTQVDEQAVAAFPPRGGGQPPSGLCHRKRPSNPEIAGVRGTEGKGRFTRLHRRGQSPQRLQSRCSAEKKKSFHYRHEGRVLRLSLPQPHQEAKKCSGRHRRPSAGAHRRRLAYRPESHREVVGTIQVHTAGRKSV